ncbi:glycogen debranching enzyme-like [Daphnia pulicaria]|uniref:glycogen debranching enzyme-like n=1 Tax=Daphnia pulicaria TaxID=35523 RepID=UPI001EE9FF4A|nr:glycogen debranching enzyme-like [Daphnia pulicaria]XP_046649157.1 glycogen debranching enzyme-like [Daphnia pulicaria]
MTVASERSERSERSVGGSGSNRTVTGPVQTRVLLLNDGDNTEHILYRLQKGWKLQFRLGPSLLGRRIRLYVNHPVADEDGNVEFFERTQYRQVEWQHDSRNKDDDTAVYADIPTIAPGSYHYYLIDHESEDPKPCGSGFFLVDPVLTYGYDDEILPIDCIHCQTVLTKCLGPFSQWEDRLRVAKESGYNLIHFTPVQELGGSMSCYSLKDQHRFNPMYYDEGREYTMEDVAKLVQKMRNEWKILSISDIVLNHTANDSPWLQEHPESTYNLINSPHLRPAYLFDRLLHYLAVDIGAGKYNDRGIDTSITNDDQIENIGRLLREQQIPSLRLHEFFLADVEALVAEFLEMMDERLALNEIPALCASVSLKLIQDPQYRRFKTTVDMDTALDLYNTPRSEAYDEETRRRISADKFRSAIEQLNGAKYNEIESHLSSAVNNILSTVRYERLQWDGPKLKQVSAQQPLVTPYFYKTTTHTLAEEEAIMFTPEAAFIMAHNGWVMNDDPLRNFAEQGSNIYIRRELIAWGDSVKLRYGERPEDSPYLWEHMRQYTEETASVFHGIRLDNCHSTPIHVAQYLLDAARKVRPDLYVIAELFTNSDRTDNIFVNRLGISSLIREGMSAGNSHELGRLIHRFGGDPVGAFIQPLARPLQPSIAHAILLDQSHDNPSPVQKRSVYDLLPSAALISMASCATGSNRGYDELVPHHIHVVKESRLYATSSELPGPSSSLDFGIIKAKRALNDMHLELGTAGYSQVYVDQMTTDVVAVTRHCPVTHQSIVLVAHTAFNHPDEGAQQGYIKPLVLDGRVEEVVLEAQLSHKNFNQGGSRFVSPNGHKPHPGRINGCDEYQCNVRQRVRVEDSQMLKRISDGSSDASGKTVLHFHDFFPGSVVAIRVSLTSEAQSAVVHLRSLLTGLALPILPSTVTSPTVPTSANLEDLQRALSSMTLVDLNMALYRCHEEEVEDGRPGSYVIPGSGPFNYCGLQGVMSLLSDIRPKNDLGHPLCANLREGDWLSAYVGNRLMQHTGTAELGRWLETALSPLSNLPRFLVPCYFDAVITGTYLVLLERAWSLMSKFVNESSTFVKAVALGSVQFVGLMGNARLPELSPSLAPPVPPIRIRNGQQEQACATISAGLPHFSVGYMRNWGRDTFISLRGLLLLTGRYQEARYIILAFGGCLRHGLIPNLLDGGSKARFNCRDAIWWWLQSICDYCRLAPRGHTILDDAVTRLFPDDESPPLPAGAKNQPLCDVMQEALQRHFQGVEFRERNAGFAIDREMLDTGFNNEVGVSVETGFVFGGNAHNCGTWMDKMGSSAKAGNKGEPATPRDGSAVEIVGLSRSVVGYLWELFTAGTYPYAGVERINKDGTKTRWTYDEWTRQIDRNFERHFWINVDPEPTAEPHPELINRRGIYKDSYMASKPWADYQLRPNFVVAMAVAPTMFTPSRAWQALQMALQHLLGPLGMATLDNSDWSYRPDYFNSDEGDDPSTAHGFNYHQGPEWLWPVGFLLQAMLYFAPLVGGVSELRKTIRKVKSILSRHFVEIQQSPWRSLPELTNKNGKVCNDSSPAQAWSMATILEVLHELDNIEHKQKLSITAL